MLRDDQITRLQGFLQELDRDQQLWTAGYITGRLTVAPSASSPDVAPSRVSAGRVTVYYATETGNGKAIALSLQKTLRQKGFKTANASVARLKPSDLSSVEQAVFVCSTHGEGDPPEGARDFFHTLASATDDLSGLSYALLGLGDRAYESFCGAALQLDACLQRMGAKPLADPVLLDVDFSRHVPAWIQEIVGLFAPGEKGMAPVDPEIDVAVLRGTNRLDPIKATVKYITDLNDTGSDRKTVHIELVPEVPLHYTPGDSVGIILEGDSDPPRLYSISSSPEAHPGEIHLTVILDTFIREDGSTGYGKCSEFLCNLHKDDTLSIYIHANLLFHLPDAGQDAIMIGPGTGVAPFRSFLYERLESGHSGRNWLVFGNPKQHCDFLYQAEWQEHLAIEGLHKISLAFSRDQAEKIYVQHRLHDAADELRTWVERGAAIYVCGTKSPMGEDVEQALHDILGSDRLDAMKDKETYIKEVY